MDVSPMDHPEWMNPRFAAWYRFLTPRLVRKVRRVLTISEFTKERIVHYCPDAASKIHVVYLAADKRFSRVDEEKIYETQMALGIPSPHFLVALGSLEPRKNLKHLLLAWARVQARIPKDVYLVLAGALGKRMVFGDVSFEDLPPRVHLTGHVPDELLPALYSGAIASLYLSLYEGFGLPPLEAMACGTPVLTSNVTSLPEVVGNAGITVDPYDTDAIGEALIRLVADSGLRLELRRLGLEQARRFSWDKTADETWQVLEQAAKA
jgi:glycosyltransferase involved in cell wall biosynthesis